MQPWEWMVLLGSIVGAVVVGHLMFKDRKSASVPAKPGDAKSPVVDPHPNWMEDLRAEAIWEAHERERAAAWAAWEETRDQTIRDLMTNPPSVLFKIERGTDNIYRVLMLRIIPTSTPRYSFDHSDDELVQRQDYRSFGAGNPYRQARIKHPWPDGRLLYSETWVKMNDMAFAFLQEAEQWLDDYLNPVGRQWGYDAFANKVSVEGEPTPVVPISRHFAEVDTVLSPPKAPLGWETAERSDLSDTTYKLDSPNSIEFD